MFKGFRLPFLRAVAVICLFSWRRLFPGEGFKFGERVDFLNHFGKAGMEDGGDFFAGCFVVHAFAQGDVFGGEVVVELDFGVVVDFKLSNHGGVPLGWLG